MVIIVLMVGNHGNGAYLGGKCVNLMLFLYNLNPTRVIMYTVGSTSGTKDWDTEHDFFKVGPASQTVAQH